MRNDFDVRKKYLENMQNNTKTFDYYNPQITRQDIIGHRKLLTDAKQIHRDLNTIPVFDDRQPLDFFKFWQEKLGLVAKEMLSAYQESQRLKELFSRAQAISQHAATPAKSAVPVNSVDAVATAVSNDSISGDQQTTTEEFIVRPLDYYLEQDDETAQAATTHDEDGSTPATVEISSLKTLFKSRHVDYKALLRQFNRDFRGQISIAISGNLTTLKLTHNGHMVFAMYDTPHGAQIEKAYPHWRIAIQEMFIKAGFGR